MLVLFPPVGKAGTHGASVALNVVVERAGVIALYDAGYLFGLPGPLEEAAEDRFPEAGKEVEERFELLSPVLVFHMVLSHLFERG